MREFVGVVVVRGGGVEGGVEGGVDGGVGGVGVEGEVGVVIDRNA
jgi:hypothetical protein